jgi:hypothetical protein
VEDAPVNLNLLNWGPKNLGMGGTFGWAVLWSGHISQKNPSNSGKPRNWRRFGRWWKISDNPVANRKRRFVLFFGGGKTDGVFAAQSGDGKLRTNSIADNRVPEICGTTLTHSHFLHRLFGSKGQSYWFNAQPPPVRNSLPFPTGTGYAYFQVFFYF